MSIPVRAIFVLLGSAAGYLVCIIIANLEIFQFYTIRSLATGKRTMSEIVMDPVDRWVTSLIVPAFLLVGGILGLYSSRLFSKRL